MWNTHLLVLSLIFGRDFLGVFSGRSPGEAREAQFVSFVLNDARHTWDRLLAEEAGVS